MDDVDAALESFAAALDRGDDAGAFATIDALAPTPRLEAYDRAQRHWYWTRKDLARVRAISRAGIRVATALADTSADADQVRGRAKTLAYNLASFTWPGWDEPGVTPTPADLADGRDAARLNLRLAILLGKPDRALADAWWLIGAHAMASRDLADAADAFAEARAFARRAGEAGREAMLDGYAALVESLANPVAIDLFDESIAALRANADGSSYAEQLVTARRVFASRQEPDRVGPVR